MLAGERTVKSGPANEPAVLNIVPPKERHSQAFRAEWGLQADGTLETSAARRGPKVKA